MLNHITWPAYLAGMIALTVAYYLIVILKFYRADLALFINGKLNQKMIFREIQSSNRSINIDVIGLIQPEPEQIIEDDQLVFGEPESDDDTPSDKQFESDFEEMKSEVDTLISVIAETNENKETFGVLFSLLTEKYQELRGGYLQDSLNSYLLEAAEGKFTFTLTANDLASFWSNNQPNIHAI